MEDKKKTILYGDERYIRDFLYIFDDIKPAYFIDDTANDFAVSWERIKQENFENVKIIICKYDERTAVKNLTNLGLEKHTHFVSATSFFSRLDFPIRDIARKKNVYVWGTGMVAHTFFHEYVEHNPDTEIAGCIDSDSSHVGQTFFRRPVFSPQEALNDKNAFFIIATTKYYSEIRDVLESAGLKEQNDFIHCRMINNTASRLVREMFYDLPRVNYMCKKAFTDGSLSNEGFLSVCAFAYIPDCFAYYGDFYNLWHSNIMKIFRLSVINGTYIFCNKKECPYLKNCGHAEIDVNDIHYQVAVAEGVRTAEELRQYACMPALPKNTVFDARRYEMKENPYPDTLMLAYDYTCNLSCPSCRHEVSVMRGDEKNMAGAFTKRLERDVFSHIRRIKIAGNGEAFFSPLYRYLLFDAPSLHGKDIGILSNGSLFDEDNFRRVAARFSEISVMISMDGARKETAEKLRRGVNFDTWQQNMRYLGRMRKEGRIKFLGFNFVVQEDNYLEMKEYVKMCLGFHADKIKFSPINNVRGYDTRKFYGMSLFYYDGTMKNKLAKAIDDDIFSDSSVKLFEWVEW